MKKFLAVVLLGFVCCAVETRAQDEPDGDQDRPDTAAVNNAVRQLGSVAPATREHGAEELARLGASDQRLLVEGYRQQEKDKGVRLALDWALYRMGSTERLYNVVNELTGKLGPQAVRYLSEIDDPAALYPVLGTVSGKSLVGVLQALGAIGNAGTLSKIGLFKSNSDPLVARAATAAEAAIQQRIDQTPVAPGSRDRVANPPNEDAP